VSLLNKRATWGLDTAGRCMGSRKRKRQTRRGCDPGTRQEALEAAVAEAMSQGRMPWGLMWRLDQMAEAPRKQQRPRCGAKTRSGRPCRAPAVWDRLHHRPRNGRCRMHGGLSTGPRTKAGKARIAASNRRRAKARGRRNYGGAAQGD
jgi:hypothetical protein